MDKFRDRVQGIEKKMRMKLHLQDLQPRLGEPSFKLRGLQLTLAILSVIKYRLMDRDSAPIDRDRKMKIDEEKDLVVFPEGARLEPRKITELRQYECVDRHNAERNDDTCDQVDRDRLLPFAVFERISLAEPEDCRTREKPCVARRKLPRQYSPERYRILGKLILKLKLTREKQAKERPNAEDQQPLRDRASTRN